MPRRSHLGLWLVIFSCLAAVGAQANLSKHWSSDQPVGYGTYLGPDTYPLTPDVKLTGRVEDGDYQIAVGVLQNGGFFDSHLFTWHVAGGVVTSAPPAWYTDVQNMGNGATISLFWDRYSGNNAYTYSFSDDSPRFTTNPLDVADDQPPHAEPIDFTYMINGLPADWVTTEDKKDGGDQCHGGDAPPMAQYSVHSRLVSLNLQDRPLRYTPPIGPPVDFVVTYNQKESLQPAVFDYSNLGPKWTLNWLAYVTDDPASQRLEIPVFVPGGGTESYPFDSYLQVYLPHPQSHSVLVKTGTDSYERRLPDGSKQVFGVSDGAPVYPRRIFMTQLVDAAGNTVTIGYDSSFRITTLTDALGLVTTLAYELPDDPLKITKVTDPFGRFASFQYSSGQLSMITDEIGIQSQFSYTSGTDSIASLTTPYGTTQFSSGANGTNRWIETTDPLGGKERVEYRDYAPDIASSDPVAPNVTGISNSGLDVANTFYWDKKAMAVAPGDYTKAKITHWLYNADGSLSPIPSNEKAALENRVWYTYAGQPDATHVGPSANPSQVARVLGDGSTQLSQFEYNAIGRTTKATDPVGRVITSIYDTNNVDLLEVRQTTGTNNELLRKFTYNSQHEPLTDTDTAGQVTIFDYNTFGQMLTRQNAKSEITTFAYGGTVPDRYLASITSPSFNGSSAVTSFAYDSFNRVRMVTDSDGYAVTTDYDNLDRTTKVTYPDATYEQFQYTDNVTGTMTLDLTGSRDRRGLWTYLHYNGNRQMDSITDPASRTTQYGWCMCGALETITDPKSQITTFNRDIQSRVYQKVFNDGTAINYLYEGQTAPNTAGATSRMKSSTDAKNQRTNYTYFGDDNVAQISYTDTNGQPLNPATPSVSYTYDLNYNRPLTMIDGSGTTIYGYNPVTAPPALGAGRLASIDGALPTDTITFTYDQLGRVTNRSINGAANSETWTFDSLGRVSTDANKLGAFNYSYINVTNRLSTLTYPGGTTVNYTYFPNAQDKRLQQIKNQTSASVLLSQFDYTYDTEGEIKTLTKNYPGLATPQRYDLGYDYADQLLTAPLKKTTNNALVRQYIYGYDLASNRTSEQVGNTTTTSTPNSVNEITSQSGGTNRTLSYEANGSLVSDGGARTFEWDGTNRLVAVNYTGTTQRSEFSYDGLNRCTKIVEKTGTTVNSTRKFVWCGSEKCEFRNANNAVQLQLYPQGQYQSNTAYFYLRDHLGSIREMVNGSGTVVARYDYDPYGRSTTVIGTNKPDFNFTGLYQHAKSGLDMAVYRAYDPNLGRWLSRDPIAEDGGLNLYGYVGNDPTNHADALGLLVDAYLNEAQGIVTIIDRDTGRGASFRGGAGADGTPYRNNWNEEGRFGLGPLPRGDYDILNRIQGGNPNLDGVPAWALDRKDRIPRDDIAQGYGRSAFRFHFGRSEGCVTTHDSNGFDAAVNILNHTSTQRVTDANGRGRTYYGDFHVFSGVGTAPAVFP